MELQDTLIVVNGKKVKVADVLTYLKATGVFRDSVCRLVEIEVIQSKAKELGAEVPDSEFYDYASAKRRQAHLVKPEDMQAYCRANGITVEQWNQIIRDELLLQKVRARVVSERDVVEYFESHRDQYKTLSVSRIVHSSPATAKALLERVQSGENFCDIARRHSQEEHTRSAGGYLGTLKRRMLAPKIEEGLLKSHAGDVLGPFQEGNWWSIYRVDSMREAELNNGTRKEISDQLFRTWLQSAIAASRFEKPK